MQVGQLADRIDACTRDVPDFPKPGIVFKDFADLFADPDLFATIVAALAEAGRDDAGATVVDTVVGIESRGFILAAPVALALGAGFVPVRKPGKLPGEVRSQIYALEYGTDTLEIQAGAVRGARVLLIDDVLATGGTAAAAAELIRGEGGVVHGIGVLLELGFLDGRARLGDQHLTALRTV